MFAESLIETSWAQRSRRSWTTLTSFGIQAIAIGVLLSIPLLTTVIVPAVRTVSTPISMRRSDPGQAPLPTHGFHSSVVEIISDAHQIMAPRYIPHTIARGPDSGPAGPAIGNPPIGDIGLPFSPTSGPPLPFSGIRQIMPIHPAVNAHPFFRTSSMLQGSLIRRVEPTYPPLARTARIQGPVVLSAIISNTGAIENLRLISGHPLLAPAAIDAVSQWRYKPYILNGEAIEVETQITVNFVLSN
ncbi:MAG: energy transducer TonB [Candidatus Sulfotelmatobacter sp.]